jgi:hypothetical protein
MEEEGIRTSGTVTYKKVTMEETSIQPFDIGEIYKRIEDLSGMVNMLGFEVSILKDRVDSLERKIESSPMSVRIVEVRETTVEEAKEKILEYYEKHKDEITYPDDVADELGFDLKIAMRVVKELINEGKLEEVK